ncbi:restriction endonuclease subunit S [Roseomonas sp. E05]|uniref:restriction endonuclease subunit S n=1 Tax=Roseomonas sp. E05 TaxID=3046310 RepID=UPI0024B96C30|nr:restriction endonuclease subunit S [Roseomonas sp. E05]MDJ0390269.1 restriction endonuclease subunit S [Roseomonas sp. E05]
MSVKTYPAYRESCEPSIGLLPSTWTARRLKFLATVQTGVTKGKDTAGFETVTVSYLRVANVQDGYIDLDDVSTIEIAASDVERYLLRSGDVLMNEGGDFDKLGRGHVWRGQISNCVHQNHVFAVRTHSIEPEWIAMVSSAECGRFFFMSRAKQSTNLASISSSNLLELPVPCPPTSVERRAILTFLDHETRKIDALVAEQERLIALLKEKRQAVISQAVTKGLDPDAPMKDSGVEWLGEVPKHWEVKPLKRCAAFVSGGTPSKEREDYWQGDIPWVSPKDMKQWVVSGDADGITPDAVEASRLTLLPENSVLVVVRGMILAHSFPVAVSGRQVTINQDMKALLPKAGIAAIFLGRFLSANAKAVAEWIDEAGHGTRALRMEGFVCLPVAIPPEDEQNRIVSYLTEALAKLDALADNAERAITLLRERRAALISAAVTGKIDVRDLAAAEKAAAA